MLAGVQKFHAIPYEKIVQTDFQLTWASELLVAIVVHTFKQYLQNQWASLDQILSISSLGGGKAALGFWADWIKTGCHANQMFPLIGSFIKLAGDDFKTSYGLPSDPEKLFCCKLCCI